VTPDPKSFADELEQELLGNIVPFWVRHAFDDESGGLTGGLTHDGLRRTEPRSTVLAARVLWTFASVADAYPQAAEARAAADRALEVLLSRHADAECGGFFWSVDAHGRPLDDRKHAYANAFAVYGLTAYHRIRPDVSALRRAQSVFDLLQDHAWDGELGGYLEGCSREWGALDDFRLSDKEPNVPKTMNTHLHVLEAWTELLRATGRSDVAEAHRQTLRILLGRMRDADTGHFRQFFERDWTPIPADVSYGHDIEAAWLLRRAAEVDGDPDLADATRRAAIVIADRVLQVALTPGGAFLYAGTPETPKNTNVEWWAQAEAIVGFLDAFEASGEERFLEAAHRIWRFVRRHVSDPVGGDWIKSQTRDLRLNPNSLRAGPWECPYHHARMCLEGIRRLRAL